MRVVRAAIVAALAVCVSPLLRAQTYNTGFEPPTFTLGDVQGQDGWGYLSNSPTKGNIALVPVGSPLTFGAQSLEIRTNNVDFFGVANHLFSALIDEPAGETGATAGGAVIANPHSTFQASFYYRTPAAPLVSTRADGRFAELNPSSKSYANLPTDVANRYAQVRLFNTTNTAAGLVRVEIGWYINDATAFTTAVVATNLAWDTWYRFDYLITLVDGENGTEPNDRFRLSVFDLAGTQLGTACGSTWEMGWKRIVSFGGGLGPRAINGFDFWAVTGPNNVLVGTIDQFGMTASTPSAPPLQAVISGNATVCSGGTTTLTATPSGGTGVFTAIEWRDAANAVVGTSSTLAAGVGTYTAVVTDSSCLTATSAPFPVSSFPPLLVGVSGNTSICFGETTTLTASASGGSGSVSGYVWRDSVNNVVSSSATLTAGPGTYTVTATDAVCGDLAVATVNVLQTCKATPTVTWNNPADIIYGTPLSGTQLNATASVPGTFVYTPPAGTVLNAGPNQTLTVDFTPTDSANYNSVNGTTVQINVLKAPTTTTITSATPNPSSSGEPVSITASVNSPNGTPTGTVTITNGVHACTAPLSSPTCSISFSSGGSRTVTATYSGDSNFLGSSGTAVQRVIAAPPNASALVSGSRSICAGGSANIVVSLTGTSPWTLTWSDGLVETVNSSPHIRTVSPSATTAYSVTSVADSGGSGPVAGNAVITVIVVPAPVISVSGQPQLGSPFTLSATPGYASYQWFRNGSPIVGANGSELSIATVTEADLGTYTVTAQRDGCTSAASTAVSLVPLALPSDDAVIPVVGNTPGAEGSLFRTTVHLVNATDDTMEGEITFINGLPKYPYTLQPHETRFIDDLLPASFSGLTSADVRRLRGPLPVVLAHVFNDGGPLGTSGLIERAIPVESALTAGDRAVLLTPIDPGTTRFNVGLRSLSQGMTARVTRRDAAGAVRGTFDRTLPPSTFVQEPVATLAGAAVGSSESLTFEIMEGRGVIYGAATDNGTNDPNMQIATKLGTEVTSGRYVLPVAGAVDGAFGSSFASGLQIHNPSDLPLAAALTFHAQGSSSTAGDLHMDVVVPPHATLALDDVVASMHGSGLGSVDVVTPAAVRPVMLARVYSIAPEGETSLMTELVAEEEFLGAGEVGVIASPHDTEHSRFNIGVRSLAAGAQITATVRNTAGEVVKVTPLTVAPTFFYQLPASTLLGVTLTGDESVVFRVEQGNAVIYGVWVDNVTQDPALQYAVRP